MVKLSVKFFRKLVKCQWKKTHKSIFINLSKIQSIRQRMNHFACMQRLGNKTLASNQSSVEL